MDSTKRSQGAGPGEQEKMDKVNLTKEEIQEGYDISLLDLQPRTSSSTTDSNPPHVSSFSTSSRRTSSVYQPVPSLGGEGAGARSAAKKYEERAREIESLRKRGKSSGLGVGAAGGSGGGVLSRLLGGDEDVERDEDREEKGALGEKKTGRNRKKVWIIVGGILLLFIVLGVGLGVGLQKNSSSSLSDGKDAAAQSDEASSGSSSSDPNSVPSISTPSTSSDPWASIPTELDSTDWDTIEPSSAFSSAEEVWNSWTSTELIPEPTPTPTPTATLDPETTTIMETWAEGTNVATPTGAETTDWNADTGGIEGSTSIEGGSGPEATEAGGEGAGEVVGMRK
ncbi:uncharacterized protein JCM6883_000729 [Sporobolomyces salmoneus]|uniref:uncharacterized protein n=1 Tax=Sporobolomyces salmoneus TaxID=183962 RepID=UPI00317DD331